MINGIFTYLFYVCNILVFVENKSGSKILFIIYFQKFNFHRLHTKDHQWSSSPFNFISANTCPVESTDTHLQRICAFFSYRASYLVRSVNPLHKIKLD